MTSITSSNYLFLSRGLALKLGLAFSLLCFAFTTSADAHRSKFKHRHNAAGAIITLGIAGIILGGALSNQNSRKAGVRRSKHCHGGAFCHVHNSRGLHTHDSAGRVIYKKRGKVKRSVRRTSKHIAYCRKKYRSYRVSDNTFQPFKGKRRACRSPYR